MTEKTKNLKGNFNQIYFLRILGNSTIYSLFIIGWSISESSVDMSYISSPNLFFGSQH